MKTPTARWLLAPLRQLRTLQLMARHGPTLPYETAWALTTLRTSPDEAAFLRAWSRENPCGAPGVHYDQWHTLDPAEQRRRRRWLNRHGHSPIQRLGLEPSLIQSAGIHVLDWSRPSDTDGRQPSAQPHQPDYS